MKTLISLALAVAAAPAPSQSDWPQRPVRMLVGFGPGGGTDIVAPALGDGLGQPVVVENRPGAGGAVAAAQVAKSPADGYTAFMLNNGFAVSAVMSRALPYDPLADYQPVSMVATMPLVVLTGPKSGFSDLKGLVDAAKANPGKLNFGTTGVGGSGQASENGAGQRNGGVGAEIRPDGAEFEQQIEAGPKGGAGSGAEKADENGFAGVERIAHDGEIVDGLHENADRGEPEHMAAMLRRDERTEEPFAPADIGAHHQQSGAHQRSPTLCEVRRWRTEFVLLPDRKTFGHEPLWYHATFTFNKREALPL